MDASPLKLRRVDGATFMSASAPVSGVSHGASAVTLRSRLIVYLCTLVSLLLLCCGAQWWWTHAILSAALPPALIASPFRTLTDVPVAATADHPAAAGPCAKVYSGVWFCLCEDASNSQAAGLPADCIHELLESHPRIRVLLSFDADTPDPIAEPPSLLPSLEARGIDFIHLPIPLAVDHPSNAGAGQGNNGVAAHWVDKRGIRIARDIRRVHQRGQEEVVLVLCAYKDTHCVHSGLAVLAAWHLLDSAHSCHTSEAVRAGGPCGPLQPHFGSRWERSVQYMQQRLRQAEDVRRRHGGDASGGTTNGASSEPAVRPDAWLSPVGSSVLPLVLSDGLANLEHRVWGDDRGAASVLLRDVEDTLSEVYPAMWLTSLGGVRHHAPLLHSKHHIGLVVNLCDEEHQGSTLRHFTQDGIEYHFLPTVEAGSTDIVHSRALPIATLIQRAHAAGRGALVHCCAGLNRSVTVVLVWRMLQLMQECITLAAASTTTASASQPCVPVSWSSLLSQMESARPGVGPMPEFRAQLDTWQQLMQASPSKDWTTLP